MNTKKPLNIYTKNVTVNVNKCPGYDTKQSDGDAPMMMELRGMRNITFRHHDVRKIERKRI